MRSSPVLASAMGDNAVNERIGIGAVSRRQVIAGLLAGAAVPLTSRAASAALGWCRIEPIVRIGGQVVAIHPAAYTKKRHFATEPTQLVISIPVGVSHRVLAVDKGFGAGYAVSWVEAPDLVASPGVMPVRVEMLVVGPDSGMPVRLVVSGKGPGPVGDGEAEGVANSWVALEIGGLIGPGAA